MNNHAIGLAVLGSVSRRIIEKLADVFVFFQRKITQGAELISAPFLLRVLMISALGVPAVNAAVGAIPGEFSVSPSGAATYSIPIQVPPGIGGMQPKLSLECNSQAGNGLLGVGWTFGGLSIITRCPTTIAQDGFIDVVNFDEDDRFCLDGQRLVAINGGTYGADGAEYRTEIDAYSKIISYGQQGGGPEYFRVWTKSGEALEFGVTGDSKIERQGGVPSLSPVRVWAMNKMTDTSGNYLTVTYEENIATGEYFPLHIDYSGNDGGSIGQTASLYFEYEGRPDPESFYVVNRIVQVLGRLSNIKTYHSGGLIYDYQLAYATSELSGRSYLDNVTQCDAMRCNAMQWVTACLQ